MRLAVVLLALAVSACDSTTHAPPARHDRAPEPTTSSVFGASDKDTNNDDGENTPTSSPQWQPTAFSVEVHGTGRPVILIPGLACPGSVWNDTVAHFESDPGAYQTHVLTLAGFAGQPRIDGPLAATTRDELVRYIREHRLESPIIVGHSMGGLIAYWLAASEADLVGATIVVDSGAVVGGDDREGSAASAAQVRDMWKSASDDAYTQQVRDIFGQMAAKPARIAPFLDDVARSDRTAIGDAVYELATIDVRPKLATVRSPVLAVLADGGNQETFRRSAELTPDHTVVVVPSTGHFVMLDDPPAFFAAVDKFLTAHATRSLASL